MKVLLIGGSGLIGQSLSRELQQHGYEVTILTRRNLDHPSRIKVVYRHWDGHDAGELCNLLDGHQVVINLAGESIGKGAWTLERKSVLLTSRVEPSLALVEAIKMSSKQPALLIQASAVGYYGTGEDERDETSPAGSDFLSQLAQKWEAASLPVEELGVRRIIIRSGVVLTKNGGVLAQLTLPFRLFAGGPIGNGRQWISWIHMSDEIKAIRFLIENPVAKGVYNLSAPEPVTNAQMGRALAKGMHRPYWMPVPAFALKLVLGEMSTLVVDGQRVIPAKLNEMGYVFEYPSLQSALADLLS